MRVLLGFPQRDRMTGVYVKNAFEELGHELVGVHDPKRERPEKFLGLARSRRPDLIFMSRSLPYCGIIGELRETALTSFWNVDVQPDVAAWDHLMPLMRGCHFWFTIAKGQLEEFRKRSGNPHVYWLSEGCDRIHRLRRGGRTNRYDVFFAGSVDGLHEEYGRRKTLLDMIRARSFRSKLVNGLKLFNKRHNDFVGRSKVCLGNSAFPQIELSMSARDYRILGAGGFLLTNHVRGIETWFEVGRECETYRTPEEALEKIDYYITHDRERVEIADRGYAAAHAKHRFRNRIAEVVKVAETF